MAPGSLYLRCLTTCTAPQTNGVAILYDGKDFYGSWILVSKMLDHLEYWWGLKLLGQNPPYQGIFKGNPTLNWSTNYHWFREAFPLKLLNVIKKLILNMNVQKRIFSSLIFKIKIKLFFLVKIYNEIWTYLFDKEISRKYLYIIVFRIALCS